MKLCVNVLLFPLLFQRFDNHCPTGKHGVEVRILWAFITLKCSNLKTIQIACDK